MKSNKYKIRLYRYNDELVSLLIYKQRRDRPLMIWGEIDEDRLFNCSGAWTPSQSARDFMQRSSTHPIESGINAQYVLPGSITIDDSLLGILHKFRQKSFYPEVGRYKRGVVYEDQLNPMLLIEYIKKNAKFYGKQEKIFGDGAKSS